MEYTLKDNEYHPASIISLDYIKSIDPIKMMQYKEAISLSTLNLIS